MSLGGVRGSSSAERARRGPREGKGGKRSGEREREMAQATWLSGRGYDFGCSSLLPLSLSILVPLAGATGFAHHMFWIRGTECGHRDGLEESETPEPAEGKIETYLLTVWHRSGLKREKVKLPNCQSLEPKRNREQLRCDSQARLREEKSFRRGFWNGSTLMVLI